MKLPWKPNIAILKPWNYLRKLWKPTQNHKKKHENQLKIMNNRDDTMKNWFYIFFKIPNILFEEGKILCERLVTPIW